MTMHFAVMGVPRSGTTAAVNALNLHPQIMCGDEYFPDVEVACSATLPAAFENEEISRMPNSERTRALFRLKRSGTRIYGNKDPRYFFSLRYLNIAAPACKRVCIYRPRLGFWNSWDARARNPEDVYWGRGQTGFFGALELICLLGAVADVDSNGEVLLVNYEDLFFDNLGTIQTIYDYLGAAPNLEVVTSFQKSFFSHAGVARKQPNPDAERTYQQLELDALERKLFARPTVTNVEVAGILRDYCLSCRPLVTELIDSQFPNMRAAEWTYFIGAKFLRDALTQQNIQTRAQHAIDGDKKSSNRLVVELSQLQRRFDEAPMP